MKETFESGRVTLHGVVQFGRHRELLLDRESLLFVCFSALDLLMTWLLLTHQGPADHISFVESNPIARYFLYSWGFDGLIGFKIATVSFVIAICQVIAFQRRDVARRLLQFATIAAMSVVVYSVLLMVRHT
jgi:hypothetical protein